MYADDILLIAPSVSELQRLFHACEFELSCLDTGYVYQHQEIMLYTYWSQGRFYVGAGGGPPPNVGQAPSPHIFWFQQQKYASLKSRLFLYSGEINTRIS